MPQRKTASNLQDDMREICRDWGITHNRFKVVVSDGGANIKAAVRTEFSEDKHVSWFAHLPNRV